MMKRKRIGIAFALIALLATFLFVWRPFQQKRPFLRIPIVFLQGFPCIRTIIEGNSYFFALDSGSAGYFSMQQEVLDAIKNKTEVQPRIWNDIQKNQYSSPSFAVNEINIETFKIKNAASFREETKFITDGSRIIKPSNAPFKPTHAHQGRIGSKTLRILDYWLVDFPHSELVAIRDIEKIKGDPSFSLDGFVEVKIEPSNAQIILLAKTDFGQKRLALDTGAWRSLLNLPSKESSNHQIIQSEHLIISGHDFGITDFYIYQFPSDFKIDGILGLDFFKEHIIYLDFKKNRALISSDKIKNERTL